MLKIGHRGAKAYAAENTLTSFREALNLGVDMVECDVRITQDGYPVAIHDATLVRLAKTKGLIKNKTLAEIKKIKIKGHETVPTLGEVLEIIDGKIGLNIELKVKNSAQIVVQTLRDYKIDFEKIMISSNHPSEIKMVVEIEPQITTALILRSLNAFNFWMISDFFAILFFPLTKYYMWWLAKITHADYLNINHRFLSRQRVALLKKHGVKICAWSVDNPKKIAYLKSLGIDGIITNYPDRL